MLRELLSLLNPRRFCINPQLQPYLYGCKKPGETNCEEKVTKSALQKWRALFIFSLSWALTPLRGASTGLNLRPCGRMPIPLAGYHPLAGLMSLVHLTSGGERVSVCRI
jgi:hypothetical protein